VKFNALITKDQRIGVDLIYVDLIGGKIWVEGIEKAGEERSGEVPTVRAVPKRRKQNLRPDKPKPKNSLSA